MERKGIHIKKDLIPKCHRRELLQIGSQKLLSMQDAYKWSFNLSVLIRI